MKNTIYQTLLLLALLSGCALPGHARAFVPKSPESAALFHEKTPPENRKKRGSLRERLAGRLLERRLERLMNRLEKQYAAQDTCDLIVLKDSSVVWAQVQTHNLEYIRYVPCDYPEAPYNQIYWPEVRELRMADGRTIYPPDIPTDEQGNSLNKKAENNLLLSILGLGLMFTGVGAFLGIIVCIVSLIRGVRLKKVMPENKNVRWSIALSIIGIGILIATIMFVFLLLALLA